MCWTPTLIGHKYIANKEACRVTGTLPCIRNGINCDEALYDYTRTLHTLRLLHMLHTLLTLHMLHTLRRLHVLQTLPTLHMLHTL